MTLDIREVDPCDGCMRTRHSFEVTEDRATQAGAYLLASALETADSEVVIDPDIEQEMSSFLHNQRGIPRGAGGAVGHCGRAIGRGACGSWEVAVDLGTIVPKS